MKFAFQSDTFSSFTFRSDTWAGSRIREIFCHSFTTQANFLQFVADFNAAIANPSQFSAADQAFLDLYDDGVVGYDDRDGWLDYLLKVNPPGLVNGRLPWANPANSDPLGLRGARPNVIVVDNQNVNAVKVRNEDFGNVKSNQVRSQSGADLGSLWNDIGGGPGTGPGYLHLLWYDPQSMSEGPLAGAGITWSTCRRLPNDGNEATLYVRGGAYDEVSEITLVKNNDAVPEATKATYRVYPGEVATISHRNSQSGAQYRVNQGLNITRKVTWEGFEHVGYVGAIGSRIFCPNMVLVAGRAHFDSMKPLNTADGTVIRKCRFRDHRSISPTHPQAAALPHLVDTQYNNRTSGTSGAAQGITIKSKNVLFEQNYCRGVTDDWPYSQSLDFSGETLLCLGSYAGNITIRRNTFDGQAYHNQIGGGGCWGGPVIVEYNDVRNPAHACISIGQAGSIVRYNRIHTTHRYAFQTHAVQVTPPAVGVTASGSIYGNVFYNFGTLGATNASNTGLLLSRTLAGALIDGIEIYQNIIWGAGITFADLITALGEGVKNINVHDNVFVDVLQANKNQPASYNAVILLLGLLNPQTNSFYGSQIRNNIVRRTDGNTQLMGRQPAGAATVYYDLAGLNAFPNCSGNTSADPMFSDPANGIFTVTSSSPVYGWFDENVPLEPFDDEDLLNGVCPI